MIVFWGFGVFFEREILPLFIIEAFQTSPVEFSGGFLLHEAAELPGELGLGIR